MDGRLVGTIRYWPIMVADNATPALLLGPVAVDGDYRTHGIGALLIRSSLAHAKVLGHKLVILVGDEPYYGRYGFHPAASWGISMQSENPARVLALPLDEAAEMPVGLVQRWRSVRGRGRAALAA
jgi:predicted N-acetyltransferase YhbS